MHTAAILASFAGVILTVVAAGLFLAAALAPAQKVRVERRVNAFTALGTGIFFTLGGTVLLTYSMGA